MVGEAGAVAVCPFCVCITIRTLVIDKSCMAYTIYIQVGPYLSVEVASLGEGTRERYAHACI